MFSKEHFFFCLKLQPNKNLFLKDGENFKIGGVTKKTKMNFMNKQTFFLYYVLGKMKFRVEKNIFFCYTPYLNVFPISFQEQVLFLF